MSDKIYTVLHLHTELSLLDSCTNHKLYADRAVELGQKAICYTEHGNIYSWIEKKQYANSKGLKYLHGVEIYITQNEIGEKKIRDNMHTILIARNYEGVKEINILVDKSTQEDHFYYKPRITLNEFKNISNNVIKLSACLASPLNVLRDESLIQYYDFLEVQPHVNSEEQKFYNLWLYKMSRKYNKPLVACTDTHSLNSYKAECRSILQKAKKIEFTNEDEYDLTYKSYDELVDMFERQGALPKNIYLEAIENTNVIADMVEDFKLDTSFKYPKLYDNEEEVLKKRINDMYNDKVKRRVIQKDIRYKQMVQEEMRVFKKIGMVGFMLFMSELVCWCWDNDIPVGFCRGSVGGSMVAYLTDIIDVNPLVWNTMFSRFANEDRKEIGDIDLDIAPSQRYLVYEHIIESFGVDKTGYVLAIGTISDKGTIDEIGRALDIPLDTVKKIKDEYDADKEKARENYPELFYYFDGLKDTAISQSMHPAGIIVSPVTLPDNYGTFWSKGKRILNINMEEIHDVSLVKYDLLGLKNIEIIHDTCKLANIPYPKSHTLNWNNQEVWKHITDSPVGIFQFESPYAFKLLKQFKPVEVNSLSLVNASLRPSGESYRDRLLAGETNKNPSELIDSLLAPNHGFLVFQEDTIKFLQQICGLSGSDADNIRRAIGRKQKDRLEKAMPQILEGYCRMSNKPREIAEQEAKAFLQIIEDSANYQFGLNHSTGYSMIGYTCGYLRYYYPKEFITAYLNNANNDDDINMGTELASQLNIPIHSIKFRYSLDKYSCDKSGIYKGIASIKFCNSKIAQELYELRDNQYDTFIDLLVDIHEKTSTDSKQLNILVCLDFFSEFGEINKLLKQIEVFNTIYGRKTVKREDEKIYIGDYSISLKRFRDIFAKDILENGGIYKESKKQIKGFDSVKLIKEICKDIDYPITTLKDRINYELQHLGYIQIIEPLASNNLYLVTSIDKKNKYAIVNLYSVKTGINNQCKIWLNNFNSNPFDEGQFIKILKLDKKNKRIPSDKVNPSTGKKIWIDDPSGVKDFFLVGYSIE